MKSFKILQWSSRTFEAARFGLITALLAVGVATAGMELTWRSMSSETQGFIEQSIGDTASLMAGHIRSEVASRIKLIQKSADQLLRPEPERLIEPSSEIYQISVWARDNSGMPYRVHGWVHPHYRNQAVSESTEAALLSRLSRQRTAVISQSTRFESSNVLWFALPMDPSAAQGLIVSAYMQSFQLQRIFRKEQLVKTLVVDQSGAIVGHPEGKSAAGIADLPLIRAVELHENASKPSLQMRFEAADGNSYYGGFQRIDAGGLAIIASVSDSEARSGLSSLRMRSIQFILLTLLITFCVGFGYSSHRSSGRRDRRSRAEGQTGPPPMNPSVMIAGASSIPPGTLERSPRVLVYGTLRGVGPMLEEASTETLIESLLEGINHAMELFAHRVREFGGVYEHHSGVAFNAVFDHSERALACVLQLRRDFAQLNQGRRLDGLKELSYGFGIHAESALMARVGPGGARKEALVGESPLIARSLEVLAETLGVDVLATHSLGEALEKGFLCKRMGETALTRRTGLCEYFWIEGLRDVEGQALPVITPLARVSSSSDASVSASLEARRWMIHNGTQFVGPYDADQIAAQLFSQEIDFDSDCRLDGSDTVQPLISAGVFGVAMDAGASLWVFDGKTVHGPLTQGFVLTAIDRGALAQESFVCEGSTISGWVPISVWVGQVRAQINADTEAGDPEAKAA